MQSCMNNRFDSYSSNDISTVTFILASILVSYLLTSGGGIFEAQSIQQDLPLCSLKLIVPLKPVTVIESCSLLSTTAHYSSHSLFSRSSVLLCSLSPPSSSSTHSALSSHIFALQTACLFASYHYCCALLEIPSFRACTRNAAALRRLLRASPRHPARVKAQSSSASL